MLLGQLQSRNIPTVVLDLFRFHNTMLVFGTCDMLIKNYTHHLLESWKSQVNLEQTVSSEIFHISEPQMTPVLIDI